MGSVFHSSGLTAGLGLAVLLSGLPGAQPGKVEAKALRSQTVLDKDRQPPRFGS